MKIQTKITLLFFTISAIGLILLHAAIFYFVYKFNFEDFFKRLETRVKIAAQTNLFPDDKSAVFLELRTRYLEKLPGEKDFFIQIYENQEFRKPLLLPNSFYKEILQKKKARFSEKNKFYAASYFSSKKGNFIVLVAASDPYGFKELTELKRILIILFIIAVVVTYVIGAVFSFYITKPVRGIIKSVNNISANNLHERLDKLDTSDEMAELVETFNHTLDRLETAFETQNNFISNASHELRTPLSIIISEGELLLKKDQQTVLNSTSVKNILDEAEKLNLILSSLLSLAQSGFDGKRQNWNLIRIDELILNVFNSITKIEPESKLQLDFEDLPSDGDLLNVKANDNLLKLAISNILLNACKYSNNQLVYVKVSADNSAIKIIVTDKGIGIPESEIAHVFEPFFRASNTHNFEGYGIGLPLTLNIIRLHKGTLGVSSIVGQGTEMQIILPVASPGSI